MFYTLVLSAVASALMSLLVSFAVRGKLKEVNDAGYPCMRFATAPFFMLVCGVVLAGFGIYEWFDPQNHHYSGNLAIMSYAPIVLGAFSFIVAAYFRSYLAVLTPEAVQVSTWPFGKREYSLERLVSIEQKGQQAFLSFSDGRKLAVTYMLSGSRYFIQCVAAWRGD